MALSHSTPAPTDVGPRRQPRAWRDPALVALAALAAQAILLLPVPLIIRAIAALTLMLLPGIPAAALLLRGQGATWAERGALAFGAGFAVMIVGGLALAYLPGPLDRRVALVGVDALLVVLLGAWLGASKDRGRTTKDQKETLQRSTTLAPRSLVLGQALLIAALVLTGALRLTHLGYAEFQGDEARAMLMANGLQQGRDDVLWLHKKGPAEVLLPALMGAAAGGIDEATARLPFAVAGVATVLALGALGWRMFGPESSRLCPRSSAANSEEGRHGRLPLRDAVLGVWVGALAAWALALDGFFQGFARIVQYQSLVVLLSIVGVWAAWRYYADGRLRWLLLGAALIAAGTLGHYEAVFALVPLAFLFGRRWWVARVSRVGDEGRHGSDEGRHGGLPLRDGLLAAGMFAAVAAFFYVPFALNPHFAETVTYILDRRIGASGGDKAGPLYNSLPDYFARATFYNSTWWMLFMVVGLVAVLGWLGWRVFGPRLQPPLPEGEGGGEGLSDDRGQRTKDQGHDPNGNYLVRHWSLVIGLVAAAWPAVAVVVAGLAGGALQVGRLNLASLLFLPLGLWLLARRLGDNVKTALIWFLPPFLVAGFLVQKPHTHFYTMWPGLALLVAFGLATLWVGGGSWRGGWLRSTVAVIALVVALLQVGYLWTVFVGHQPEYKRVYPASRNPLYPAVYGDNAPRGGYFGFPYRAGWGVVARLFETGALQGTYDSNEEPLITGWYTRGAPRCAADPQYYIVAQNVQDEVKIPLSRIERDYHLFGVVDVDGIAKLRIYSRDPVDAPRRFTLADSVRLNPRGTQGFPIGQALDVPAPQVTTDATFGPARLLGYEIDRRTVKPGEAVAITLFWEAMARPPTNWSVFVHVSDDTLRGQSDGYPACGARPTSRWQRGDLIVDSHSVRIDPATPPGQYPLRVGLYDSGSGQRVPASGADTAGDHATLGAITVRP